MNNIVIIGADSEIAKEFIKIALENSDNILSISRNNDISDIKIDDYLLNTKEIVNKIKKIDRPIVIFFNGFLAENRPVKFPTEEEIFKTEKINLLIPYLLTREIKKEINIKKFIYMSSIAAVKPRKKNYIYGLAKKNLEILISKLLKKDYLIFRFGLVKTSMSKEHSIPPFSLEGKEAARLIYKNLNKNGISYPILGLYLTAKIIYLLPLRFINFLERGIKN